MLRLAAKSAGLTAFAGSAGTYLWMRSTMGADSIDRIATYQKVAVPMIVDYKWLEWKLEKAPKVEWLRSYFPQLPEEEQKRQFQELHEKHAKPLFDLFMELGGFYYKSGQKIAANISGVCPKTYIDMFQPFLNDIPARDMDDIRSVVEGELGQKIEDIFSEFEPEPIGCASIGQVHRARLKSNGQRIVVKVQNPEAERTFRGDVFALKVVVDAFMPQLSVAFAEIERQFATEFDYRGECQNQRDVSNNLKKAGIDDIIVPELVPELCTKRMMVMEEVYPSTPLHDQLTQQAEKMARQKGMTKEEFMDAEMDRMNRVVEELAKQGKVMKSITEEQYDQYIALQKGKQGVYRALKQMYNSTFGWFTSLYDMEDDVIVPLNAARLINRLFAIHGHECLIDGCFNADPHPGNILCVDGKLALIDYGQVKRLTDQQRYDLAKTVLLVDAAIKVDPRQTPDVDPQIHARARQSVVDHVTDLGMTTKYNLPETLYEMTVVYYGRMDKAFVYPLNVIQWTDKMQQNDPMGTLPPSLDYVIMVTQTTLMLRGLGEYLMQYRNAAECWAPYARQALAERPGQLEAVENEIASWSKEN